MNRTEKEPSSKSLSTQAFERIHADILNGQLQPNERLRVQALSARYDIGPTAIREALSRLTTNALVGLEDQRGFFVTPISLEELRDLTSVRIELESSALGRAIDNGGLDWETNLLGAYHRLSKMPRPTSPATVKDWLLVHQRFHDALIEGCGSRVLLRLCSQVLDQLARYRNIAAKPPNLKVRADTHAEHRELFEAAMARDKKKAQRLLAEHFSRTARTVENTVFLKEPATESKTAKRLSRSSE